MCESSHRHRILPPDPRSQWISTYLFCVPSPMKIGAQSATPMRYLSCLYLTKSPTFTVAPCPCALDGERNHACHEHQHPCDQSDPSHEGSTSCEPSGFSVASFSRFSLVFLLHYIRRTKAQVYSKKSDLFSDFFKNLGSKYPHEHPKPHQSLAG